MILLDVLCEVFEVPPSELLTQDPAGGAPVASGGRKRAQVKRAAEKRTTARSPRA